jgi:hypothetical protein
VISCCILRAGVAGERRLSFRWSERPKLGHQIGNSWQASAHKHAHHIVLNASQQRSSRVALIEHHCQWGTFIYARARTAESGPAGIQVSGQNIVLILGMQMLVAGGSALCSRSSAHQGRRICKAHRVRRGDTEKSHYAPAATHAEHF